MASTSASRRERIGSDALAAERRIGMMFGMAVSAGPLDETAIASFLADGHVRIRKAFDVEQGRSWLDAGLRRLGWDPEDPSSWQPGRSRVPTEHRFHPRDFAPRAWAAACQLCGGEERMLDPDPHGLWNDSYLLNVHDPTAEWFPPESRRGGWHKDGGFFRHFLDSPEQALLVIIFWTEVREHSGGTFAALDSVGPVARYFARHPEGLDQTPRDDKRAMLAECERFVELTGEAGDILLIHPYLLHAPSVNPSPRLRAITNPFLQLRAPMRFDRDEHADHSPVERAVLRGLGVDRFPFHPTRERKQWKSVDGKVEPYG